MSVEQFVKSDVTDAYNHLTRTDTTVGYERLDDDHLVKLDIPPYIVENRGDFFAFNEVTIGSMLREQDSKIAIMNPPKVLTKKYRHPHSHTTGDISYGTGERWKYMRINFNHLYDTDLNLASKICHLLSEGIFAIVDIHHTVQPMDKYAPKIASSLEKAKAYCLDKDISNKQIFFSH